MTPVQFHGTNIQWPHSCAMCNEEATKTITASCSVVRGALPVPLAILWVSRIVRVTYPVCKKHHFKGWLAAGLSERNVFWLALGFFSILFLLAPIGYIYRLFTTGEHEEFGSFGIVTVGFTIVYWYLYFWAKRNTPIKITNATKDTTTFEFVNDEFAKKFRTLNSSAS